jgi:hypothetical protein
VSSKVAFLEAIDAVITDENGFMLADQLIGVDLWDDMLFYA